ncbi:MAG: molybdopterin-dependent oxidoreductase, partial [Chloroflexota bacterium]
MGGHDLETITITLNGVEVSGHPGMTVLELARESGVHIPTLCHHPHLAPIGACRICLVEEEKSRALLASCVTPIAPGMMINTASPRVLERRKTIVRLMLASHPDSCMVCDKGNRCELRKVAADMGVGLIELDRIPQLATIEEVNPFIERDHSRCILCAKCIRADQELVVEGAIDYLNRGFCSKPATLGDLPLEKSECTFCGTCVAVCPTGALMEKVKPYRGAVATTVATVCPFCGCGCAIYLDVKGGSVVRSGPRENSSVNGPALCVRGSYGCDFIHSPERLTTPMVRVDGELKAASWEQALSLAARELLRIREAYGPGSMAILGSSKCTNEENYLLQKLARTVLGTNNIDNGSRLYGGPSHARTTPGVPGTVNAVEDIERSDVILVVGSDPTVSAPLIGYAIKRAVRQRGAKLLLVEPRGTRLTRFAHLWLRARPGTDVCLINGLARAAIEEGLSGRESASSGVQGFDTYKENLRKYTGQHVTKVTGVRAEDIRAAGQLLARARHASVVFGSGITQQAQGADAVLALLNLATLTSNRGRVCALLKENNARGACDMGALPDLLPGYQSMTDTQARKGFEGHWGVTLPSQPGLTAVEMVQRAKEGSIKAMYVVGENPALSFPHLSLVREALASLEFLVVQDMFLTET